MSESRLAEMLERTRREVDAVLDQMPESLLEARRVITRELKFEPRPEELQTIVKIAGAGADECEGGEVDERYELPRQLLSMRVLIERELNANWAAPGLDPEQLERCANLVPELIRAVEEQEQQEAPAPGDTPTAIGADQKNWLLLVRDVLAPPKDKLQALTVLTPRLQSIAGALTEGTEDPVLEFLDEEEREMFRSALDGTVEGEDCGNLPSRVCLDAIAVRTLLDEALAGWHDTERDDEQARAEAEPEQPEDPLFVQRMAEIEIARAEIVNRLRQAEIAYRVVSDRLQKHQDEALTAALEEFAEEMRSIKSGLFSVWLKVAPVLRDGGRREESLAEAARGDASADERQTREELYLNALKGLKKTRGQQARAVSPRIEARQREKKRIIVMLAITVVLAAISFAVHWRMPRGGWEPIHVALKDFAPSFSMSDVAPVGNMMYARVSDWGEMEPMQRREKASDLAERAEEKGFAALYVVDDTGEPVASWRKGLGVKLESSSVAKPTQLRPATP